MNVSPPNGDPHWSGASTAWGAAAPARRTHPLSSVALILAILSPFCFGMILGPIAIYMGRKVINDIRVDPSGRTGATIAWWSIALGSAAAIAWTSAILYRVALLSSLAGIALITTGALLGVGAILGRSRATLATLLAVFALGDLLGAVPGVVTQRSHARTCEARFNEVTPLASHADTEADLKTRVLLFDSDDLQRAIGTAYAACDDAHDGARTSALLQLRFETRRKADDARNQLAAEAKDRAVRERFASDARKVRGYLATAANDVARKDWAQLYLSLQAATNVLAAWKNTIVEDSDDYRSLSQDVAALASKHAKEIESRPRSTYPSSSAAGATPSKLVVCPGALNSAEAEAELGSAGCSRASAQEGKFDYCCPASATYALRKYRCSGGDWLIGASGFNPCAP